jgi:hypothetical protein
MGLVVRRRRTLCLSTGAAQGSLLTNKGCASAHRFRSVMSLLVRRRRTLRLSTGAADGSLLTNKGCAFSAPLPQRHGALWCAEGAPQCLSTGAAHGSLLKTLGCAFSAPLPQRHGASGAPKAHPMSFDWCGSWILAHEQRVCFQRTTSATSWASWCAFGAPPQRTATAVRPDTPRNASGRRRSASAPAPDRAA